nr:LpxI family protein [Rhizobium sp. CSW-27]
MAIIAGHGFLPLHVAQAARAAGDEPFVVCLRDEADRDFSDFDHAVAGVGDQVRIQRLFRERDVRRVVMSGGVRRRPEWRQIRPTLSTLIKLPQALKTLLAGGDDAVLRMVISLFEGMGCRVVGVHEILPGLLADIGTLGRHQPDADDRRDIARGAEAARLLGQLDVGQGAVSVGGRIVALEGVEGTDAMLQRVGELRTAGRVSRRRRGALVKLCKPQQDMRADLPTIGPSTIHAIVAAGLGGIAVEAGRALIVEREAMLQAADEAGVFICGIDAGLPGQGIG